MEIKIASMWCNANDGFAEYGWGEYDFPAEKA